MNINFKTHFPWNGPDGKPEETHFKEQVLNVLDPRTYGDFENFTQENNQVGLTILVTKQLDTSLNGPSFLVLGKKRHTIRRINNNKLRYREGMKLTFSTGSRFKPERFGEVVCTGTQLLTMSISGHQEFGLDLDLTVDGREIDRFDRGSFANNDGLSLLNFTKWFLLDVLTNGPGEFQLVHWTDLRY